MEKLSAFITTYNNARTLAACLESVKWADECVVLDSYSSDDTPAIAARYHCRFHQHEFMGYGPQKQMALEKTTYRWVLLLDADEALSPELQQEIQALMQAGPQADGYELARQEQMFWRMANPRARMNYYLRLFDKSKGRICDMPVHAAPKVEGRTERLKGAFYHYGEVSVDEKVAKINAYSTGLVADKVAKEKRPGPWIMVVYPPVYFVRTYVFKRNYLNGWPGFMASVVSAFYVFLKYAKLYEHQQRQAHGDSLLPKGAPSSFLSKDA
ncbi:MAG TPA: glycosyltransferase family 2 protein [Gammaproteobacteria bacterium]|nr:glycosyltransferase family 2 protein [Gammaproteobacteria bacterium]